MIHQQPHLFRPRPRFGLLGPDESHALRCAPYRREPSSVGGAWKSSAVPRRNELVPLRVGAVSVICRVRVSVLRHDPSRYATPDVSLFGPQKGLSIRRDRFGLSGVDLSSGSSAGPAMTDQDNYFKLLAPRLVRLSEEQRREAVALLADLRLEAARKRAGVSGGASDGVSGGASGSVVELPDRRGKARRCA
jgi:hypothetical protein